VSANIKPIGSIKSCYPDKFGTPRQPGLVEKAWAEIFFNPEIQPELALQGLNGFSHIWVLFEFHKNESARYHAKVHPPRLGGQSIGVFATRSPHRPNPIGLSLVEIVEIKKDSIVVAGADIIDGTPIYDIKPYLPEIESKPLARTGWTSEAKTNSIQIRWSQEQLNILQLWSQRIDKCQLKEIIEQSLCLDPRPLVYRGYESKAEGPYRDSHAVRFFDGDVHFKFITATEIEVLNIKF
jgi:tRNA-Thr(GGU) m(6)t(6)A37 methyltransferase TsaA